MSRARTLADQFNSDGDLALTPVASVNAGQIGGRRNLIINGAMEVAQRGTSFSGQTNNYPVDRFNYNQSSSATMNLEQSSDAPDGFLNSAKLTVNAVDTSIASTDYSQLVHKIEGLNIAHLNWGSSSAKTVTLSFWVKCSVTGDWPVRLVNSDGSKSYAFYFTVNTADTWEYKTKTIEGPTSGTFLTTNGNGLELGVGFATGSTYAGATANQWSTVTSYASSNLANNTGWIGTTGNTFLITGVQLEVGSAATDFEHRSYGEELALCQRYYEFLYTMDGCHAGTFGGWSHENRQCVPHYKVRKRAVPTITFYDYSTNISGTPWVTRDFQTVATQDCFKFNSRFFATTEYIYIDRPNGSIIADAEL